jgi:tRNA (guanine37-N1)-methyltransferase
MLSVGVVTVFPEMLRALTDYGVTGRAARNGLLEVLPFNPRDFATDAHHSVDDRPYGGGPGMVMMVEPLRSAIRAARGRVAGAEVIYLSPQGRRIGQPDIRELAARKSVILVAGRYEGIDERLIESEVDAEWSIGDYVLSGGELAAMVLVDAAARLLPGTLGNAESCRDESFMDGLLDYPHYTRPEEVEGMRVPDVLLGGNHEHIRRWRLKQALERTWKRRPDLLDGRRLDPEQQMLLEECMRDAATD